MAYSKNITGFMFGVGLLLMQGCATPSLSMKKSPQPAKETNSASTSSALSAEKVDQKAQQQFNEALKAMQAGQDKAAEDMLLDITRNFPKFSGPYTNLGIVYYRSNRVKEAEGAFIKAIGVNQKNKVAHNYLGIIYRNAGRFDEARKAYEAALAIDTKYAGAHLNLGILLDLYLQNPDQALIHYQQYQQLTAPPDKQVTNWIADLKHRASKPDISSEAKK